MKDHFPWYIEHKSFDRHILKMSKGLAETPEFSSMPINLVAFMFVFCFSFMLSGFPRSLSGFKCLTASIRQIIQEDLGKCYLLPSLDPVTHEEPGGEEWQLENPPQRFKHSQSTCLSEPSIILQHRSQMHRRGTPDQHRVRKALRPLLFWS